MDDQIEESNPQPDKWRGRFGFIMCWLGGGVVGLIIGLFLLILNETINLPLLGSIIAGQREFLEDIVFYLLYDHFRSTDPIDFISLLLFSVIWGIVGALFLSEKRDNSD